ncbi:MAG: ABC transporter ATP-binding protein [Thermoanaerobaculia bacterium]
MTSAGASPALAPAVPTREASLLRVAELRVDVLVDGILRPAVDGVSFTIERGECLAVVGESGCGKTMVGRALLDLLPEGARRSGIVHFEGRDLSGVSDRGWSQIRGRRIALVFQEPGAALDPVRTIGAQIDEALRRDSAGDSTGRRRRAEALLAEVAFPDPARGLSEYPHRLSGGQRQRAFLAIALARDPALLVADEPTASLDATVAADVHDLLDRLRRERGLATLLITHDLSSAARRADRAMVLYAGRVAEEGPAQAVFFEPRHPYTRALLACVPRLSDSTSRLSRLPAIPGSVPDLAFRPRRCCAFVPRCPDRFAPCDREEPLLYPAGTSVARCFLYDPSRDAGTSSPP